MLITLQFQTSHGKHCCCLWEPALPDWLTRTIRWCSWGRNLVCHNHQSHTNGQRSRSREHSLKENMFHRELDWEFNNVKPKDRKKVKNVILNSFATQSFECMQLPEAWKYAHCGNTLQYLSQVIVFSNKMVIVP